MSEEETTITYEKIAELCLTFETVVKYIACFLTGGLVVSGSLGFLLFLIWLTAVAAFSIATYENHKKEEEADARE